MADVGLCVLNMMGPGESWINWLTCQSPFEALGMSWPSRNLEVALPLKKNKSFFNSKDKLIQRLRNGLNLE